MEPTGNNQNQPQIQENPQPTQNQAPSAVPNNNKSFFAVFFAILILVIGMIIFILMTQNQTDRVTNPQQNNVIVPTQIPSPTQTTEENEVEAVDIDDINPTEFSEIEEDVQAL